MQENAEREILFDLFAENRKEGGRLHLDEYIMLMEEHGVDNGCNRRNECRDNCRVDICGGYCDPYGYDKSGGWC